MPARPCLFVACAPSGSRIHPPYVKLFRKHCPAESTRFVERPKNQGPEQLRLFSLGSAQAEYAWFTAKAVGRPGFHHGRRVFGHGDGIATGINSRCEPEELFISVSRE